MARVLVVTSDRNECLGIANHLLDKGFEVAVADSMPKAIRELESAGDLLPDVIMLNLFMPAFEGYLLLQRLSKTERYKDTAVILSSYDGVEDRSLSFNTACAAAQFVEEDKQLAALFTKEWTDGTKSVA